MQFKDIIGQTQIKQQLISTVANNRVAHAQLFFGGEGRGKLKLALAYAQFISCRDEAKIQKGDSCGTCLSCIKYNKLIHPDLHFIFPVASSKLVNDDKPKSNLFLKYWREFLIENDFYVSLNDWINKIDIERKQAIINTHDCNEIIRTLSYTSYESEYKVMVIWMIEKLYHAAAPKILKILEEPPEKTLFLLVAENTDLIISTILSRLHRVKIPPIENDAIMKACTERLHLDQTLAKQTTLLANGNYKKAVMLQSATQERKETFDNYAKWMRLCYAANVPQILDFCEEISKFSREQSKRFLQFGLEAFHTCLLINIGAQKQLQIIPSESEFYNKFSPFVHKENIGDLLKELDEAIFHIERNVNVSMIYLDLSLTIARLLRAKEKQPQT